MHGNLVHNAAFNNPAVIAAVKKQLDNGMTFCPLRYTNVPAVELARKLAQITPEGFAGLFFVRGGQKPLKWL